MNNNDIFKKLRVALQLRDDQIVEILELVDFRMSKGELGNMFRNEDHPNFMECGDQVLRNFLNGLVIHLRGTKENPKNPMEVIKSHNPAGGEKIEKNIENRGKNIENRGKKKEERKPFVKSATSGSKPTFKKKPTSNFKSKDKKPEKKIEIVEKVKYKNGKK